MSKKPLDPGLASILDSIRATVGGEAPRRDGGEAPRRDGGEAPRRDGGEVPREDATLAPELVAGEAPADTPLPASEPKPPARRGPPPPQRTVEEFLAELIRPQVDAWLAAHLPEIVQKLTAEEVEKLLGKN